MPIPIYNKKAAQTARDVKATFTIDMKDGDDISMNLWMKGESDRKLFTALSPMTEGYSRTPGMPYNIKEQPTLTFVARQSGEAWNRPFVAIYEPSSVKEPGQIESVTFPVVECEEEGSHVGICVEQKNGRKDCIVSSDDASHLCSIDGLSAKAVYALCGTRAGGESTLFLGGGTLLQTPRVTIRSAEPATVLLEHRPGKGWHYEASADCTITIKGRTYAAKATAERKYLGE